MIAKQYTIPIEKTIEKVRNGENPELTAKEKHIRECFVVLEENADKEEIKKEIINMPNYFADYDTIVNFVSDKELRENHNTMPHGGFVIRSGKTGKNNDSNEIIEYSLKLDSNPEFTASVLVAYARAVYKLYQKVNMELLPFLIYHQHYSQLKHKKNCKRHIIKEERIE